MCGIIGHVGSRESAPLLLDALTRLEYRGYDSAGIAVQNGRGVSVARLAGRVKDLRPLALATLHGMSGIGHTRWATHGPPTIENAHPHRDCSGAIAVVHNGIIENADALRTKLRAKGHRFRSVTDSEVLAHLIEDAAGETLEERVMTALVPVVGTYGLAVISASEPGKIVATRRGAPLLLGIGDGEFFVASDAAPVVEHTRRVVHLDDGDVAVLTAEGYRIMNGSAVEQRRSITSIEWDLEAIELDGHPCFMIKEIHEQPRSIRQTLTGRIDPAAGTVRLGGLKPVARDLARIRRVVILGCGTSWHAGLVGRHIIERLAGIPVTVEYGSEYRYRASGPQPDLLAVAISQSGETADTLRALRVARRAGACVIGLVNVVGSTIAREADAGIYLHAGPEIGVASTKAFTSQLIALMLLGLHLGASRRPAPLRARRLLQALTTLPGQIEQTIERLDRRVREAAERHVEARHALYLGRAISHPVALEGALKLKEISYMHGEGYPAAEMKHGPIALVEPGMPVVCIAPRDHTHRKVVSNMQEVKARGARVIAVTTEGHDPLTGLADTVFPVPEVPTLLSPILTVLPLQLFAYHVATLRGLDVDRPRNLAKSVTVE